jgi:N-succinyldiaminopimelate aminotransferase
VPDGRLAAFATTIFTEMTALAVQTGAVNLGQGFPDSDGPPELLAAAAEAIAAGHNQYPPLPGVPVLRQAIADHQRRFYHLEVDPDTEVQVTVGATEAITAAVLGLCLPGDEVVLIEPYYDSYAAAIALAGATRKLVTLRPPDFRLDPDELRAAIGPRTRLVILNSPHNPTGRVLSEEEIEGVAAVCRERDVVVITDEVYEHLIFEGRHIPLATREGMWDKVLTVSSAGKTFSCTGWKVGWATGPAPLVAAVRQIKQFLTFAVGTPFQHAVAAALGLPDERFRSFGTALAAKRDLLVEGLASAGFDVLRPQGTYFIVTDAAPLGCTDALQFCRELPARAGVVAVPVSVFYDDADAGRTLVRFACCKRDEVLGEAVVRLKAMAP